MHQTLVAIKQNLEQTIAQLRSGIPSDEPFGTAHGNWSFPGLTRTELVEEAQSIIDLIESGGTDNVGDHEVRLNDYVRRLQHIQTQTIPNIWGNAGQGVPAFMFTLQGLRKALLPVLSRDGQVEAAFKLKRLADQLRAMEARLRDLEPRTGSLAMMVERIEKGHDAADRLPADLETLSEARQKVEDLLREATKDQARLLSIREQADTYDKHLSKSADEAKAVLERCESAYSAATSVGLAAAFSERSTRLSISMWVWVFGLVAALAAGSYYASARIHVLSEISKSPNVSTSSVILNIILSLLTVSATVWFAWLATKQIGQRFRLAEDYAFKASISRAYEGFRREAARIDKDMEVRLLASALSRLDELPLRLVEADSHGSPWHELASSDLVKEAMKSVPGFTEQIKDLARNVLGAVAPSSGKPAPLQIPVKEE